jgi:carbon storage regulator
MLALTRRIGEEIVIGDPRNPLGVIRVVDIHGDKVRLSFDFPRQMQINRRELAEAKAKQESGDGGGEDASSNGRCPLCGKQTETA